MLARIPPAFVAVVAAGLRSSTDAMAADSSKPIDLAPPPHGFGDAGEVAISGATHAGLAYVASGPHALAQASAFVSASVDVFVMHGLSLGAQFGFDHSALTGQPFSEEVSLGPRVGYNVSLSDRWSIWPGASASYGAGWNESGPVGRYTVSVDVFAPVLYHPAPHFFVGLGPTASAIVTWWPGFDSIQTTTLALAANVGGWIGP